MLETSPQQTVDMRAPPQASEGSEMQKQITFRGLPPSASLVEEVYRRSDKMRALLPGLSSCHVLVESAASSERGPTACRITVRLQSGGRRAFAVGGVQSTAARELRPTLSKAFSAARRQLETTGARPRSVPPPHQP